MACRYVEPVFSFVQTLQQEAAAVLMNEVLRVMQVLADTQDLAPMVCLPYGPASELPAHACSLRVVPRLIVPSH